MPRIYEMRTYVAHEGRLDDLVARFRDHTRKLFDKHGITSVGYWIPVGDAGTQSDTIVYLLSYADRPSADAAWTAFRADPAWGEVRRVTESNGPIVKKIMSVFLAPTDFSPLS